MRVSSVEWHATHHVAENQRHRLCRPVRVSGYYERQKHQESSPTTRYRLPQENALRQVGSASCRRKETLIKRTPCSNAEKGQLLTRRPQAREDEP